MALYLVSTGMYWQVILTSYEAHQRAQRRSERTIQGRHNLLTSLARETGKQPADITLDDLLARMGRGIAASSMQRERSDLQSFFGWAKEHHYIPKNPARKLPAVTVPRGKPRPFTMTQVQAILSSGAYTRTRHMILLAVYLGLRAFEIAKFRTEDIDHGSGTVRVLGKGNKDRSVPLHPVIAAIASEYGPGYWFPSRNTNQQGHIHYRSVSDLMTRAIRRAGITDQKLTGHSLRHTFATELVAGGVDIRIVQELMRHESLQSTQIYTQITIEQMRTGQSVLPVVNLPSSSGRLAA